MLPVRASVVAGSRMACRIGQVRANGSVPPGLEPYISPVNGAPRLPSPWNKWFPYEPVPCSPRLAPYFEQVDSHTLYHWCSCGECVNQPWSDDAGGGCRSRGFTSVTFVPKYTGTKMICGCKHCPKPDISTPSCLMPWMDNNPFQACGAIIMTCFVGGFLLTEIQHP